MNSEIKNFRVDETRKKVWSVELDMLKWFDGFCRKYNLRYFATSGTLLGAVRHGGFIPWDDDVDLMMFRDDYERMKSLIINDLPDYYFFQTYYTDNLVMDMAKIRDNRTTAYDSAFGADVNHGIFIDIFVFDDWYGDIHDSIVKVQQELWDVCLNPATVIRKMINRDSFALPEDILIDLIVAPVQDRIKQFDDFCLSKYGNSDKVTFFTSGAGPKSEIREKKWFEKTVYLPFEDMMMPVPGEYNNFLKSIYGEPMKPLMGTQKHVNIVFEPDVSYKEFIRDMKMEA